jgi:hypothetical protein
MYSRPAPTTQTGRSRHVNLDPAAMTKDLIRVAASDATRVMLASDAIRTARAVAADIATKTGDPIAAGTISTETDL